jgi:quercetin dioxygenase-like cupin family protein
VGLGLVCGSAMFPASRVSCVGRLPDLCPSEKCTEVDVVEETLIQRGTTLVRRLVLEGGEATPWHVDPYHRVTIIVRGKALAIEYRDGGETGRVEVAAGEADWDVPTDRAHRAVNVAEETYEEVTVFFLDRSDATPQPIAE